MHMTELWWPRFIRKPRLKLRLPQLGMVRMPSKWILFAIILGVYYFVVSGSIYTLTYVPAPLGQSSGGQILLLAPRLHQQFIIEGIVGGSFYFLGFLGFYLAYQSTRHIYRPRYAQMTLAAGWLLILISFMGCQWLITLKIYFPYG